MPKKENELSKNAVKIVFELTEKSLIFYFGNNTKAINWGEFKTFRLEQNNLILITDKFEPYILGEIEIGQENFEKIISFVEKKLIGYKSIDT